MMKKTFFAALALVAAPVMLTACGSEQTEETSDGVGLEIKNARLILPAVEGNPSAVYFDMKNPSEKIIPIGSVSVEKATKTMIHGFYVYEDQPEKAPRMVELGPQVVKSGETMNFEPGDKHVMVMDLDPTVKAGDTLKITLNIAGGDVQSFTANVVAPGEGLLEEAEESEE